jgi:paraquat-inducible protein B
MKPMADGDDIPQAVERRPGPRSMQLVWLVPIAAALIGGWIALKSYWEQGPTITIQFSTGEGIEAGKTRIKHKAVDIGTVKSVGLSDDRKSVVVTAEIDRKAARGFLVEDTRFWVVRPRIAGGQVSGLGTLLAGSYIGGDPGKSGTERRQFVGLESPPPITSDLPGRQFALGADDLGSLDTGSPVYYRGLVAGRVVSTEIRADGRTVGVGVFIHAPYDRFVTPDTRFWNASGVDLKLDAAGVTLQTQSLITLLVGGIAFETPDDNGASGVAAAGSQFRLWNNKGEAMRPRETVIEHYAMTFDQSVRGLAVGAPVDFRGIVVGEVRRIGLAFDREDRRFRTLVEIQFWPERLRSRYRDPERGAAAKAQPGERMQRLVGYGLRGQLRTANLITGQLYVALDFFPKAPKAALDTKRAPPEIPTLSGGLSELQESVGNIVQKLEKVPFDLIGQDVRRALASLDTTLKRADTLMSQLSTEVAPEIKRTLEEARRTLSSAQQVLSSDSPVQGGLRETLHEVTRAAESVRALTDYLERHPEALIRGKRGGGDGK